MGLLGVLCDEGACPGAVTQHVCPAIVSSTLPDLLLIPAGVGSAMVLGLTSVFFGAFFVVSITLMVWLW